MALTMLWRPCGVSRSDVSQGGLEIAISQQRGGRSRSRGAPMRGWRETRTFFGGSARALAKGQATLRTYEASFRAVPGSWPRRPEAPPAGGDENFGPLGRRAAIHSARLEALRGAASGPAG